MKSEKAKVAAGMASQSTEKGAKIDPKEFRLKDHDFYKKYFGEEIEGFEDLVELYKEKDPFDFGQEITGEIKTVRGSHLETEEEFVFVGQVKPLEETPHGAGIMVTLNGIIDEGFFQDGKKHGKGRSMNSFGDWSHGHYKNNQNHGEWT
eukprot:CAMPEP_0205801810 /NCGR_PEP_ID=MMETSP0205-20121125/3928_1 /ASSEMBLY_ACC=CAM_ASM_000278 /TAXON_ID=36767 /ORGANISM="Euplotes focardii, Strain TN1" /LENGTH=148 /DNA_ID=CAMNT_0053067189 /DNA_START=111 /DNA_END=557 /DNA_ORIENTATION=+